MVQTFGTLHITSPAGRRDVGVSSLAPTGQLGFENCAFGANSRSVGLDLKEDLTILSTSTPQLPVVSGGFLIGKRLPKTTCWGVLVYIVFFFF